MADGLNVVNVGDVERFCALFAERVRRDEARRWFLRNLRNWLLREPLLCRPVASSAEADELVAAGLLAPLPGWAAAALADGRTLHVFDPGRNESWGGGVDFIQALHGVADWAEALPADDRRWRQFGKMSVGDAVRAAEAWHAALARRAADDAPEDWAGLETVMRFPDGAKFVRLASAAALAREGAVMGHCVGGYAGRVAEGACAIYSLRDVRNRPHVTVEVHAGAAAQIKGTANTVVVARWRPHVRAFVLANGWRVGVDGERIGMVSVGARTFGCQEDLEAALVAEHREGAAGAAALAAGYLDWLARNRALAGAAAHPALRDAVAADLAPSGAAMGREELARTVRRLRALAAVGVPAGDDVALRVVRAVAAREAVEVRPAAADEAARLFGLGAAAARVPATPYSLLAQGLVPSAVEGAVREVCRAALEAAFAAVERRPEALWSVEVVSLLAPGRPDDQPERLARLAAFCGLSGRLERLREAAAAAKRRVAQSRMLDLSRVRRDLRAAPERRRAADNAVRVHWPRLDEALRRGRLGSAWVGL